MKIVLISNLYEPYARGGAEVIVKRTVEELIKQGHQVSIITAQPFKGLSSLTPNESRDGKLNIIRFFPLNIFFYAHDHKWPFFMRAIWHLFDIFNIHSAIEVKQILQEERPDLVITHNLIGLGYFIPRVIASLSLKHIHVLHDIQLAVRSGVMKKGEEEGFGRTGFFAKIYQALTRWCFKPIKRVISPSEFLMRYYTDLGFFADAKQDIIRNPIDQRFYDVVWQARELQQPHFAFIGQLVAHKGIYTLKEAFTKLDDTDMRLTIVGDGPLRSDVSDWAKMDSRVSFKGRMENKYLPDFLATVDAVIVPTLTYENSPTVVFEALAAGIPVVVSNIGGTAEPVVQGETGYIIQPGDVFELAKAIKKMAQGHLGMHDVSKESVQGMGSEEYVKKLLDNL